ncbi:hypothetical protein NO932_11645 [Pelagibacterium sp. 26DY04]|uniref:hypothetical protein n=1 Tax=Pelagibacterium sp. 26DY04 TaxID=2967130 RepID=UPI0028153774|nr:hypothetical protein [Pelagibacterium sp. 26DY04]WMT85581.1 hypothetical protein NO932_11645 [Pelagibacterium sp. 26DY04]
MRDFAKRWIEADMAEAFPEVPREILEQFAEGQAEQVAQELSRPLDPVEHAFLYGDGKPWKGGLV